MKYSTTGADAFVPQIHLTSSEIVVTRSNDTRPIKRKVQKRSSHAKIGLRATEHRSMAEIHQKSRRRGQFVDIE